jgi:cyclopropane fatty-acyl-phospholipid synthase-like methyltransferase
LDLPRSFTIRESSHRILNPFTSEKLATLGAAVGLRAGMSLLDLCCGRGEMLSSWARDHGITGTGVDISTGQPFPSAVRIPGIRVTARERGTGRTG